MSITPDIRGLRLDEWQKAFMDKFKKEKIELSHVEKFVLGLFIQHIQTIYNKLKDHIHVFLNKDENHEKYLEFESDKYSLAKHMTLINFLAARIATILRREHVNKNKQKEEKWKIINSRYKGFSKGEINQVFKLDPVLMPSSVSKPDSSEERIIEPLTDDISMKSDNKNRINAGNTEISKQSVKSEGIEKRQNAKIPAKFARQGKTAKTYGDLTPPPHSMKKIFNPVAMSIFAVVMTIIFFIFAILAL